MHTEQIELKSIDQVDQINKRSLPSNKKRTVIIKLNIINYRPIFIATVVNFNKY